MQNKNKSQNTKWKIENKEGDGYLTTEDRDEEKDGEQQEIDGEDEPRRRITFLSML